MGGKQFYEDHLLFRDWRLQENVVMGYFRLLDGKNNRHTLGSYERCADRLAKIRQKHNLTPYTGKAVILMHGLAGSRSYFNKMAHYLEQEGGYKVYNISYASTRRDMAAHAQCLERIIDGLEGVEEINFVGHSMGNIVVRYYLAELQRKGKQVPPRHRIRRIVMLAPPNKGAMLADRYGRNQVYVLFAGTSGTQLGKKWEELSPKLAVPSCQFGIIAGGGPKGGGRNPLIPGDDDLVVRVEETKLPGARDFIVVPAIHRFIMDDKQVQEYTLSFLKNGHFVSEYKRWPIPP
jgi:pimeloyl-ACP methyl ester carboxylesterase